MKIGIIGYGSMGKMFLWTFYETGVAAKEDLFVSNRTPERLQEAESIAHIGTNRDVAKAADIVFLSIRPGDIKMVLEEIKDDLKSDALVVSLNGSVSFALLEQVTKRKFAKVIPSVTAEIRCAQTLVCYNDLVQEADREALRPLLATMGDVVELPEQEMGMGSELASCMPGFIASIFDVICTEAKKHTTIPREQIVNIVLRTMCGTGELMLQKNMSFDDVVGRVATKGINLADTIMVGALPGDAPLTAVAQSNQFVSIFQICCMGLGMGASVLTSRYWGMKDNKSLKKAVTIMLRLTILLAGLFTLASLFFPRGILRLYIKEPEIIDEATRYFVYMVPCYILLGLSLTSTIVLRTTGQTLVPLLVSIGAFFVNVFFNYMFIFGKFGAHHEGRGCRPRRPSAPPPRCHSR